MKKNERGLRQGRFDNFCCSAPAGFLRDLDAAAAAARESRSKFVRRAIQERIAREARPKVTQ